MTNIFDREYIQKLGDLAAINIDRTDAERYSEQLNSIFDLINELKKIDVTDTEPMHSPVADSMLLTLHKDRLTNREEEYIGLKAQNSAITANSPVKAEENCFVVPITVES